ncbi:MAG: hypothetical protein FJ317_06995 [SAR202 cluster bacterium]|nr:hypothetical protein [SAR202 cluster bacterium]
MLGSDKLLVFTFRAVVLLILLAILWVTLAGPYNSALVAIARPIAPEALSLRTVGSDILMTHPGFGDTLSVHGLSLHYGIILMGVLILAAVDIRPIPRIT